MGDPINLDIKPKISGLVLKINWNPAVAGSNPAVVTKQTKKGNKMTTFNQSWLVDWTVIPNEKTYINYEADGETTLGKFEIRVINLNETGFDYALYFFPNKQFIDMFKDELSTDPTDTGFVIATSIGFPYTEKWGETIARVLAVGWMISKRNLTDVTFNSWGEEYTGFYGYFGCP